MPIIWDVGLALVAGFGFSCLHAALERRRETKVRDGMIFFLGLLFVQFLDVAVSIWCWTSIDRNWLLLYRMDPADLGNAVYLIYTIFPLLYIFGYTHNERLRKKEKDTYALAIASTAWVLLTVLVLNDFLTLFAGSDVALHGIEYPGQFIWNLETYPPGNVLWFLPVSRSSFFKIFTFTVVFLLAVFEILGIRHAKQRRRELNARFDKVPVMEVTP
ncbi:hypothetical protein GF325_11865 [Candidatus Bathyarchaeota archaeon]|nr:hypothetical protein [Candidatus Bathyarchaeota archaeon]